MKKPKKLEVETYPQMNDYLAQLIELGFGETRAEALDYVVRRSIDDMLRCGLVRLRPERRP